MNGTCVVARNGNSATVTLPARWRKGCRIEFGDELDFHATEDGRISFSKREPLPESDPYESFLGLLAAAPKIPWTRGDSPQDDKELIHGRYA